MSFKAGYAMLLGEPNVGKSTLTNVLVEADVSIVSPKPQTTRRKADGIISAEDFQLVLLDPPGWIEKADAFQKAMKVEIADSLAHADVILICIGPKSGEAITRRLIETAKKENKPMIGVALQAETGWYNESPVAAMLVEENIPRIAVSSKESPVQTRNAVLAAVKEFLPEAEKPLFDVDMYTTQNIKEMCSEFVREQCFLQLDEEVPYTSAVQIRGFFEDETTKHGKALTKIMADIVVEKDSHRPIVVGAGGQRIKSIGENSRVKMEKILDTKVYLELHVKVRDGWYNSRDSRREMGL